MVLLERPRLPYRCHFVWREAEDLPEYRIGVGSEYRRDAGASPEARAPRQTGENADPMRFSKSFGLALPPRNRWFADLYGAFPVKWLFLVYRQFFVPHLRRAKAA